MVELTQNMHYWLCFFMPACCAGFPPGMCSEYSFLNGLDPGLGLWIVAVSMSVALGTQWFTGIRWVDQKAVCIWESRAMMSHRGRSPDNLHCRSCAKARKVVHLTSHVFGAHGVSWTPSLLWDGLLVTAAAKSCSLIDCYMNCQNKEAEVEQGVALCSGP